MWNGYFLDDNYRSIQGYYAWSGDYRPISDYIYYALGLSEDFIDTYPLNYIIQFVILISFAKYFLEELMTRWLINRRLLNYVIVSIFCVFLNPFFIQNLYFRYDSLPMLLAVIAVLSLLVIDNKKKHLFMLVIALFLYQPAVLGYGIITCLRIIQLCKFQRSRKIIYLEITQNSLALLVAFLLFYTSSVLFLSPNNYSSSHFTLASSLLVLKENTEYSLHNLYFSSFLTDFGIFGGVVCFSLIYTIKIIFEYKNISIYEKCMLFSAILVIILISLININIFLQVPRLHSRTYVTVGFVILFSMFMTLLFLDEIRNVKKHKIYSYFVLLCLVYVPLTLINIYYTSYNYNQEMERYTSSILQKVESDLYIVTDHNPSTEETENNVIFTNGIVSETKRAHVLSNRFPIVKLNYSHKFNTEKHRIFFVILENDGLIFRTKDIFTPLYNQQYNQNIRRPAVISNSLYDIVKDNKNVFIFFKKEGKRVYLPSQIDRLTR